jgi:hypothetical protein
VQVDKLQFVLRAPGGSDHAAFGRRARSLAERLLELDPERLKLSWTERPPPRLSLVPFERRPVALFSIVGAAPAQQIAALLGGAGELSGYRVDEALPTAYRRDWPDGQPTPGAGLLTLLKRKPGLSDERFFHEWFGRHTPKSQRIHPLWCYERNRVEQAVLPGSTPFEGIVEERFRTRAELLNPVRLFGGPLVFLPHMVEVGLHIASFLDMRSMETYLVEELHLKS